MKKYLFIVFITNLAIILNALGTFRVESITELPATHTNLEIYDADGKFAPVLIVKTELKGLGIQNIGRPTKHSPKYISGDHHYKFYMNDNQRVVKITHSDYEPLEIRLLSDFEINVNAQRVYEMILTNTPEKEFIVINIISDPPDADKVIDGKNLGTGQSFELIIGNHSLKLQKSGYNSLTREIEVSKSNILFNNLNLYEMDPVPIIIKTVPDECEVFIDEIYLGQTTESDGIIQEWRYPGEYSIKIKKQGYIDVDDVIVISEKSNQKFDFNLIKNESTLILNIVPQDAQIKINGIDYSEKKKIKLEPNNYEIKITKSGYFDYKDNFTLTLGEEKIVIKELDKNSGAIEFKIKPNNAEISINNRDYSNKKIVALAPGTYKIEISRTGYYSFSSVEKVKLGEKITIDEELKQITGKLQFSIQPFDADVLLKKNGNIIKKWSGSKLIKNLSIGEYEIVCKRKNYKTQKKIISIIEDGKKKIEINLLFGEDETKEDRYIKFLKKFRKNILFSPTSIFYSNFGSGIKTTGLYLKRKMINNNTYYSYGIVNNTLVLIDKERNKNILTSQIDIANLSIGKIFSNINSSVWFNAEMGLDTKFNWLIDTKINGRRIINAEEKVHEFFSDSRELEIVRIDIPASLSFEFKLSSYVRIFSNNYLIVNIGLNYEILSELEENWYYYDEVKEWATNDNEFRYYGYLENSPSPLNKDDYELGRTMIWIGIGIDLW